MNRQKTVIYGQTEAPIGLINFLPLVKIYYFVMYFIAVVLQYKKRCGNVKRKNHGKSGENTRGRKVQSSFRNRSGLYPGIYRPFSRGATESQQRKNKGKAKNPKKRQKSVKKRLPYIAFGNLAACSFLIAHFSLIAASCATAQPAQTAQTAPLWVTSLENAYPSKDWVAVNGQDASQQEAESAAMNALARAFRTDVAALTQASLRYSEIIDNAAVKGKIKFDESKNFTQEVNTASNVKGLIGVQTGVYHAPDKTVHVNARMNRRECAARYRGMIRENTAIINTLLNNATVMPQQDTFGVYARLGFAHSIALATDNFQNILEVLDPTAVNRKPNYGGANAIKTKMLETAARITIGVMVDTEQQADKTLLTRAAGSYFRDLGFKTDESGMSGNPYLGNYVLRANARFETIQQNVVSCRYYLDAALVGQNGTSIFTFTEDDRKAHPDTVSEARRLAVRAAETSFKEGKFAIEFNKWLNSLVE
jgi:hypothetical protein